MDQKLSIPRSILHIISDIALMGELQHTYRIVDHYGKRCAYEVTPFKRHIKVNITSYELQY